MPYILEHRYSSSEDWEWNWEGVESSPDQYAILADRNNKAYNGRIQWRVSEIEMSDPRCWRLREQLAQSDGSRNLPPWKPSTAYYEHMDPDKPNMVRFIRDDKDGQRNRYTTMTVGRFLSRFRDFSQSDIERYCAMVGLDMEVSKLHVSKTADDFERVYLNGPHSCMAYEAVNDRYGEENIHPVRLYGDLDLAVAYIERGGDITGRALVWPEKKIHGRIYGDAHRMKLRLEEEGYTEDWNFTGARLHLDRTKYNDIRAPYVDGQMRGTISEDGKYIILNMDGNIVLQSDSGTIYTDHCGCCGGQVYTQWNEEQDCYVCDDCAGSEGYDEDD